MAVAVDVVGTEVFHASAASPRTYTGLTTGASLTNGAVAVIVIYDAQVTGSSATWDGVACTLVASKNTTNAAGGGGRVEIWALSPLGAHEGNKTFSVSWTAGGAAETYVVGVSYTGVDQTGGVTSFPHGATAGATSGTSSVTITSAAGNQVIAGHVGDNQPFSAVNQTQIFIDSSGLNVDAAANRAAGAASVTLTGTLTSTDWASAGVDILAAGAAASLVAPLTGLPVHHKFAVPYGPFDLLFSPTPAALPVTTPDLTPYNPWPQAGPILAT